MRRSSSSVRDRREDGLGSARHPCRLNLWTIAIFISFSLLIIGSAAGATLTVAPGEKIQAAIGAAGEGDTVLVESGVYRENLVLNQGIVLSGIGRPLIDAGGSGSAITLRSEEAGVVGFEVSGSGPEEMDAGIWVLAANCTIADNHIFGNSAGILLQDVRGAVITKNTVEGNGVGVYLETSWENEISFNRIVENDEGVRLIKNNVFESITESDAGGVSIKYTPKNAADTETSAVEVSDIGFAGALRENRIFGNELLNNGQNALDDGDNLWSYGDTGNHYDDFDSIEEGCRDRDRDGVCDSPRTIPGGSSVDEHPVASDDAILKYRATSGDFELFLYRSTFSPGTEIDLGFQAPQNFSGRVELVASPPLSAEEGGAEAGSAGAVPESQSLPSSSGTVRFTAPSEEGSYAFRMYDGSDSGPEIVALPFNVATAELFVYNTTAGTCDRLNVGYSGAPGFENDWIGLFRVGSGDESPLSRKYLDGTNNGTLTFNMPSSAGSYEFRMFEDDGLARIAASSPVEVEVSQGVRVEASPARVRPGEAITVSFWGAKPASAIGMYEMTRPDKYMIGMQWTNGRTCGTMTFGAPRTPGRYDFRLFEDNVHRKLMGASNVVIVG
ncbi:MAG TPA: NosD domain-containing protein [Methanothrix sp.]|nr:NosD domain-containing protein [Methanothrix sp.]HRW82745.1 NosD domain-containing protein [Methanothrix sp.]